MHGAGLRLHDSAGLSRVRKRLVLQHLPRRAAPALRFRRSVHSSPTCSIRWPTTSFPPSSCSRCCWAWRSSAWNGSRVLLDLCQVAADAVSRATRLVTALTPFGLFAISGHCRRYAQCRAARAPANLSRDLCGDRAPRESLGVARPGRCADAYSAGEVLRAPRDALITAFVAGDLFIVLPALIETSKTLIRRHGIADVERARCPTPSCRRRSTSRTAASSSRSASCCSQAGSPTPPSRLPIIRSSRSRDSSRLRQPERGGSFLLDRFRIPADTFQLFLATGVINSRFGTLLAAVHTLAVALLGMRDVRRAVLGPPPPAALRRHDRGVTAAVLGGARALFVTALVPEYQKDKILASMQLPAGAVDTLRRSQGGAASRSAPAR